MDLSKLKIGEPPRDYMANHSPSIIIVNLDLQFMFGLSHRNLQTQNQAGCVQFLETEGQSQNEKNKISMP